MKHCIHCGEHFDNVDEVISHIKSKHTMIESMECRYGMHKLCGASTVYGGANNWNQARTIESCECDCHDKVISSG